MYFPGREIPDHAVPTKPSDFVVGQIYFIVHFLSADMLVPELLPVAYLGKGLPGFGKSKYVFQDAASFLRGTSSASCSQDDPVVIHTFGARETRAVFAYDDAMNVLLGCLLRRQSKD